MTRALPGVTIPNLPIVASPPRITLVTAAARTDSRPPRSFRTLTARRSPLSRTRCPTWTCPRHARPPPQPARFRDPSRHAQIRNYFRNFTTGFGLPDFNVSLELLKLNVSNILRQLSLDVNVSLDVPLQ